MSDILVVIPTYDEKDNVGPISKAILETVPDAHILFVDDNSPDGTGRTIDALCSNDSRIHVMHKEGRFGLGRAYISGYKWALQGSYDLIFGMDADFSHDPVEIPNFIKKSATSDLVLGSRYVNGIRITNWPISRLILSQLASFYVRTITGMPILDPTGGYRCYRRETLASLNLDSIISNGYSFLVETAYTAWINGFTISEIPITFVDRRAGYSKMNMDIFKESLWTVWKLAFRHRFRRRPLAKSPFDTPPDSPPETLKT